MDLRDPIALAYLVAAISCAVIAFVSWRHRAYNPTVAITLTVVLAGSSWWSICLTISRAVPNETVAALATLAPFAGASPVCAAFMCLGVAIARPQWVPRRGVVLLLLIEPALITLFAITNPWHLLVYGGEGAAELTGHAGWTRGSVYWLDTGVTYVEMAIGLALVAWAWWRASPAFRGQRLAVFIAALVPLVANVVFLFGGPHGWASSFDPTPIGLAVTGTIVWYAVFRQDLFTFAPVARALIVDQIGDVVAVISTAGKVLDLNPAAVALVRGRDPNAPVDLIGATAVDLFGATMADTSGTATGTETELVVELSGGRTEYQVRAFPVLDRHRHDLGTVLVARDVTDANNQSRRLASAHAQMVRQLELIESLRADLVEQATRDPLTGLHNRRHMVDRFAELVATAREAGEPLVAVLFDVDRFKSINDRFGHLAGDAVLVVLANRLLALAPADALVARWGGEEFFVALPGTDAAVGVAFADTVRQECAENEISISGRMVRCTLSGGVAAYPQSGETVNDLFHAADLSLLEAKRAGRDRVHLSAPRASV
ncbi:MAG: histidine kinase N-terminal 7TM domain-containing diguanylate cyclase [Cellulomonas sp.]